MRPSLNVILRVFSPTRELLAKVKVAVFRAPDGETWYEVGYVDPRKSLQHFAANFLGAQPPRPGRFGHLRDLVDATKRFIARRPRVSGLDLTPAAYHVLPLCWKLGGRPKTPFNLPATLRVYRAALDHTLQHHAAQLPWPVEALARVDERTLISFLLAERRLFTSPHSELLTWSPPRLTCPQVRI